MSSRFATGALRRTLAAAAAVVGAGAVAGLAACADAPVTAPKPTASAGPAFGKVATGSGVTISSASFPVSQQLAGDTAVTVFVVSTDPNKPASFDIGNSSKIDFPYALQSICALNSSYGVTEWDKACTPASTPIQITAKTWLDARGTVQSEFEPALRFVPKLARSVTLYLKDPALAAAGHIDYCTAVAGCVNEALTDPSVATFQDRANGFLYRHLKHFSGYAVNW